MMETQVKKWGNGLGLRIPKALADKVGIEAGSVVDISVEDWRLVVSRPSALALAIEAAVEALAASFAAESNQGEIDMGDAAGKEVG